MVFNLSMDLNTQIDGAGLYPDYPGDLSTFVPINTMISDVDGNTGSNFSTYRLNMQFRQDDESYGWGVYTEADVHSAYSGKLVLPWGVFGLGIDPDEESAIRPYVFGGSSLQMVVLPSCCEWIGYGAFLGCTSLESINLGNVARIGRSAFSGCTSLSQLTLTNTELWSYAFSGCTSLYSLYMTGNGDIGNYAFSSCTSLDNITLRGNGDIGNYAFQGCNSMVLATMPNVPSIGEYAFYGCTSLAALDISNVESIGAAAFQNCTALYQANGVLHIPESCTFIGSLAFLRCNSISSVVFDDPEGWNEDVSDPAINRLQLCAEGVSGRWGDLYKSAA